MLQPYFQTPPEAPRWKRWLVYSALARILMFAILAFGLFVGMQVLLRDLGVSPRSLSPEVRALVRFAIQAGATVIAYVAVVMCIERRRPAELDLRRAPAQLGFGIAAGAILITVVIAILWLAGAYGVERTDPGADWMVPLLTGGLGAAVSEEIIFRGVLYRMTEEGLGSAAAVVVSALFFGFVHLANKGSTVWSSVAIAVEAGLLLGMVYHLTRTLWVCIGLHMGWNFFQGFVWGVPVSGVVEPSFIVSSRHGPEWLTGGAWGAEASVVAVLLNFGLALALLAAARRRGLWAPLRRPRTPIMEQPPSGSAPC